MTDDEVTGRRVGPESNAWGPNKGEIWIQKQTCTEERHTCEDSCTHWPGRYVSRAAAHRAQGGPGLAPSFLQALALWGARPFCGQLSARTGPAALPPTAELLWGPSL